MANKGNSAPTLKGAKGARPDWPASAVEWRSLAKLTPYARNARTHSDEQVAQIAASIKEWGWTIPVLVDESDGIIAGHGRVLAAQRLEIKDVPVLVAHGWSEAQKRAYVLADNKLTLNGGWNEDFLRTELEGLRDEGFLLSLTGFGESELDAIMNGWGANFDPVEKDGENLDGIENAIRVVVDRDSIDRAKTVITQALAEVGIVHELK